MRKATPPVPCATWWIRASCEGTAWVTGANAEQRHVLNLVMGRDFTADGTIEAAEVREGDLAPDGSGPSTWSAASRSATSSSWAASTPRPWA